MLRRIIALLAPALAICLLSACKGGSTADPIGAPSQQILESIPQTGDSARSGHYLWAYFVVSLNENGSGLEIVPAREISTHWNVLKFLEQNPCADCFKITNIEPVGADQLNVIVEITHPLGDPFFTAFDVRGIAIFNGSHEFPFHDLFISDKDLGDPEILNPDGYTNLYNGKTTGNGPNGLWGYQKGKYALGPTPNADVNAYRTFVSDDPSNTRNAFFVGDSVSVTYEVRKPQGGPFTFGYAVDANWMPPIHTPVTDPMTDFPVSANCHEAWIIDVTQGPPGGGLTPVGGEITVTIDCRDWQGFDEYYTVWIECPELWNMAYSDSSPEKISEDMYRFTLKVKNKNGAQPGSYKALIIVWDLNNSGGDNKWEYPAVFDVITIDVLSDYPQNITPEHLNFTPRRVAYDGTYAYTVSEYNGLHIFDASDPANPVWVSKVGFDTILRDVDVNDGYAYVGADGGLFIVDVDPPETAHVVNEIDFTYCYWLCFDEGRLIAASDYGGVTFVSVEPPESAEILGSVPLDGEIRGVRIDGGYAYVCGETDYPDTQGGDKPSLVIIDCSDPQNPWVVSHTILWQDPRDVEIVGDFAYVLGSGIEVYDISDKENPEHVGDNFSISEFDLSMTQFGTYLLVCGNYEIEVIDASNPYSPASIGEIDISEFGGSDISAQGTTAVFVNWGSGLHTVNVETPGSPEVIGHLFSPGFSEEVIVSGTTAFITSGWLNPVQSLMVVDLDPLDSARVNAFFVLPYEPVDMVVSDDFLFVLCCDVGDSTSIEVFDIADTDNVFNVNSFGIAEWCTGLDISGTYAFVTYDSIGSQGMFILDISSPGSISIVNNVPTAGPTEDVEVGDGYAFVASGNLEIIDVDPVDQASVVCAVPLELWDSYSKYITLWEDYAYIVNNPVSGGPEFHAIDIDPVTESHEVSSFEFDVGDRLYRPDTDGANLYVPFLLYPYLDQGVHFIGITDPESAIVDGYAHTISYPECVCYSEGLLYAASRAGLEIIEP